MNRPSAPDPSTRRRRHAICVELVGDRLQRHATLSHLSYVGGDVVAENARSAQLDALSLQLGESVLGALSDESPLELRERRQDRRH